MFHLLLAAAMSFQGQWEKACQPTQGGSGQAEKLIVQNDTWVRQTFIYQDQECRSQPFLLITHSWKASPESENFNMETMKMTYTPLTMGQASWMRAIEFCDDENWEVDQENDVTGKVCSGFQMPNQGQMTYSIIQFKDETRKSLKLGRISPDRDGKTAATRFHLYEEREFVLQPNQSSQK
jgi:hypothetical protein